jgi:TPP-dependent pyruvate/acetoin dehydrogenase alpha subunit
MGAQRIRADVRWGVTIQSRWFPPIFMPTLSSAKAAAVAGKHGYSLISNARFRELYEAMLRCRIFDEGLRSQVGAKHIGSRYIGSRYEGSRYKGSRYKGMAGAEAAAAGVVLNLEAGDVLTLPARRAAARLMRGAAMGEVASLAADAKESTTADLLGAATGAALASKLGKRKQVAAVFTGADIDRHREALELASAHKLPILYVVEDSSESGRLEELGKLFPVITVDAYDVVAVYRVAYESITRIREGAGATLIECIGGRGRDSRDAIVHMERYLQHKGIFREDWKQSRVMAFEAEITGVLSALSGSR